MNRQTARRRSSYCPFPTAYRLLPTAYSRRSRAPRRGVLLLVVLSLLVLFVIIGITFVVISGQFRRSAIANAKVEQKGDDFRKQLDDAFMQVARDTMNPASALFNHGLLTDMYGADYKGGGALKGTVAAAVTKQAQGQFLDITFKWGAVGAATTSLQQPGYINGCVLTMLTGPAAGWSTRIVGYNGIDTLRVMAFGNAPLALPNAPDLFLVNGRPFNGTGFGYNKATALLDKTMTIDGQQIPIVLLPNCKDSDQADGGADEDYDAPDLQNMLLAFAWTPADPALKAIPSLHRPDLVKYMISKYGSTWNNSDKKIAASLKRRVILRPLQDDHPNFTGSNPGFDPENGPWDVDTDGDGIPDSIWVDLGLPVQTAPDGRQFKPLVAIRCLDLDGRLNVNAHGSVGQVQTAYSQPVPTPADKLIADPMSTGNTPAQVTPPRGQGYGVAEISLQSLFASSSDYARFLAGDSTNNIEGRYGELNLAGNLVSGMYPDSDAGKAMPPLPGATTGPICASDKLSLIKHFEMPLNYYAGPISGYVTPPDLWGRGAVALDWRGQPLWMQMGQKNESLNNPYALNLSRPVARASKVNSPNDNPFTVAELERILRQYDLDAGMLPDRLRALLASSSVPVQNLITVESNDVPSFASQTLPDLRTSGDVKIAQHLAEMLKARLLKGGAAAGNIDKELRNMLPPEMMAGLRFDLNRPFGNGVDDNNNGVVDEPQEYASKKEASWTGLFPSGGSVNFDLDNDGSLSARDVLMPRHMYARHLYVLMMLLTDQGYFDWTAEQGLSVDQKKELTARRIAQWAVNVVDYRDADSIMTPFEYDVNPFNGWSVDGIIGPPSTDDASSERRLVWGCEYPDLLLTETSAFHDRRVRDTDNDKNPNNPNGGGSDKKMIVAGVPADKDLDQIRVPQGSAFFELYCTRNGNGSEAYLPADLYTNGQLDLGRKTPNGQYPIWRLAITTPTLTPTQQILSDTPNNDGRLQTHPDSTTLQPDAFNALDPAVTLPIERFVWLAPSLAPGASTVDNDNSKLDGRVYSNRAAAGAQFLLSPGGYAVIGPRATTVIGRSVGAVPADLSPQTITLNPFQTTDAITGTPNYPDNTKIKPSLSIICAADVPSWSAGKVAASGVNISEPLISTYYLEPKETDPKSGLVDSYGAEGDKSKPFIDTPLDDLPSTPIGKAKLPNGTTLNYRTVFLQRLANPLANFDPVQNPYLTVDFSPIDLTVFNGEQSPTDYSGADPYAGGGTDRFGSRQRGLSNPPDPSLRRSLWTPITEPPPVSKRDGTNTVYNTNLKHNLGYLNETYGNPWNSSSPTPPTVAYFLGDPDPNQIGGIAFPWLNWPNRPFISAYELLQVPASSPARLGWEFGMKTAANPYTANQPGSPYHPLAPFVPYNHLLNFFASDKNPDKAPNFYRLLDYVQVPSRFIGTDTYLEPVNLKNPLPSEGNLWEVHHPPFNKVSNYRDPGKMNINTIPGEPVWQGYLAGRSGPTWNDIRDSRAGTANGPAGPFGNPFRSAGGADYGLPDAPPTRSGVDVTFLRPDKSGQKPLFGVDSTNAYNNTDRNAYFRYQELQRISNLLTTRSNVYAVWVTVGYFEVKPVVNTLGYTAAEIAQIYPDGYQLHGEVGIETGEVTRHRAFYILDRTIPVGFEKGEDNNVERAILLKRFIE